MATIPLKDITFPGLDNTYTIPEIDSTLSTAGKAADAKKVGDELASASDDITALQSGKANIDGYYADLVSGGSTQLLSDMVATDTTPYNYRTAGGSLEIGDRMKLKKIVGGSLAVNQLVHHNSSTSETNGVTFTNNGDGTWTLNGEATANATKNISDFKLVAGHKYLLTGIPSGGSATTFRAFITYVGSLYSNTVFTYNESVNSAVNIGTISGYTASNLVYKPQLFDLTAMFGTTIADYVYSLETATAGAGVAWLKAHFPKIFDSGYIPYNAGTLEHVSGLSAHKMTGFNQWDEEWEVGTINSGNGQNVAASDRIRSKNYTHIINSMQYYVCLPDSVFNGSQLYVALYDADKNFIRASLFNTANGFSERILAPYFLRGASYLRFWFGGDYGITYKGDVCLNLHWDGERDGEYEPYEEHSYPLDSDVTLRGIPKLDANNNLYYDGDEYEADGTVTRKYGIVDLGTLTWAAASAYGNVYRSDANLPDAVNGNRSIGQQAPIILSTSAFKNSYNVTDAAQVATAGLIGINYNKVYVTFAEDMTAAQIKTAVSGVYMLYTLKNAYITTESADPYTEIQNVSNWGTEEFVTDALVPVGHETAYQPDLRAKIEVAPESPDTDGLYLMKRENGQNSYVAYLGELPSDPTTDGTYTLKCTVSGGTATKTWEADE